MTLALPSALTLALASGLALAACSAVAGYKAAPGSEGRDADLDPGHTDGTIADGTTFDGTTFDGADADRTIADGTPADGGAPTDGPIFEGVIASDGPPCQEDQGLPATLAQCGCDAGDCDGLPAYRDWDPGCNELLFEETFAAFPGGRWTAHASLPTTPAPWQWSCGEVAMPDASSENKWLVASEQTFTTSDPALIEVRFTLGAIGNAEAWGVGLTGRFRSDPALPETFVRCQAWVDIHQQFPVTVADLGIWLKNGAAMALRGAWPQQNVASYDPAPGQTYYLQLFTSSDVRQLAGANTPPECVDAPDCPAALCLLCDDQRCWRSAHYAFYLDRNALQYLPPRGGRVGLATYGRAARFDYLRVYARPEGLP